MKQSRRDHNSYQQTVFAEAFEFFKHPIPDDVTERTSHIVAAADLRPTDRVLDVGTGIRVLLGHIEGYGVDSVTACDLSPVMLREAKRRHQDVTYWCGDIVDLPPELGPFDAVFFNAVFGNIWDPRAARTHTVDVLSPNGRVVIGHPMGAGFVRILQQQDSDMVPHLLPDRDGIKMLIAGLGLRVVRFQDLEDLYICLLQGQGS